MADAGGPKRNPTWSRDELILALDLYVRHRNSPPGKTSREIEELSRELNVLGETLGHRNFEKYRNVNGTYMKLMNFRRLDPAYTSGGRVGLTRGGGGEEAVWNEFAADADRLHRVAQAIRENFQAGDVHPELQQLDADDTVEAQEGQLVTRLHRHRERSRKLVQRKKAQFCERHGRLFCEACRFEAEEVYGERGSGVIECHHIQPVYTLRTGVVTRLDDLALICANCHRAVHAESPWLGMEELRALVFRNE
jgi:predicted HNH restriction endonuclease